MSFGGGRNVDPDAGQAAAKPMSPPNPLFEALFHTNRPVQASPDAAVRAVPGWWGELAALALGTFNVTGPYRRSPNAMKKLKAKWNLPQSLKFEWSLAAASSDVWLLADTDTVFQCTPAELYDRFRALKTPLVVGTEFWWFPRPHGSRGPQDPYDQACGAHTLRYPNSGLLMGTRAGFAKLVREITRTPGFPCCRQLPWDRDGLHGEGGECFVDDQACMQAAMLNAMTLGVWEHAPSQHARRRRRPGVRKCAPPRNVSNAPNWRGPLPTRLVDLGNASTRVKPTVDDFGSADYALDVHANLFMNLFMIHQNDLDVNARGQLVYRKTGVAPCVIHTNAYKSPTMLNTIIDNWTGVTWVPSNSTRLQRYLMQRMAMGGANATDNATRLAIKASLLVGGRKRVPMVRQAAPVDVPRA